MPKTSLNPLPSLIFGQFNSKLDLDLHQMQASVSTITNWVSEFDVLDNSHRFQHRTATVTSNGVRLIAVASTPTVMKVYSPECTIVLPFFGEFDTWDGGRHFSYSSVSGQAAFYPPGKRHTEAGLKSVLLVSIAPQRIINTARAMLGEELAKKLDLQTPRRINTLLGSINLLEVIQQACRLFDKFQANPVLIKNFTPDDTIVRAIVMMLAPEAFLPGTPLNDDNNSLKGRTLDYLCNYVVSNLDQSFDLTQLELVSGLSARTLQNEFRRQYAMSPMQWIREQRLSQARDLLLYPQASTTVSWVATHCGFDNLSDFSRRYFTRYRELPNETLKKTRGKL